MLFSTKKDNHTEWMNPGERDAFVRGFSLAVNPLKFGSSGLFFTTSYLISMPHLLK